MEIINNCKGRGTSINAPHPHPPLSFNYYPLKGTETLSRTITVIENAATLTLEVWFLKQLPPN